MNDLRFIKILAISVTLIMLSFLRGATSSEFHIPNGQHMGEHSGYNVYRGDCNVSFLRYDYPENNCDIYIPKKDHSDDSCMYIEIYSIGVEVCDNDKYFRINWMKVKDGRASEPSDLGNHTFSYQKLSACFISDKNRFCYKTQISHSAEHFVSPHIRANQKKFTKAIISLADKTSQFLSGQPANPLVKRKKHQELLQARQELMHSRHLNDFYCLVIGFRELNVKCSSPLNLSQSFVKLNQRLSEQTRGMIGGATDRGIIYYISMLDCASTAFVPWISGCHELHSGAEKIQIGDVLKFSGILFPTKTPSFCKHWLSECQLSRNIEFDRLYVHAESITRLIGCDGTKICAQRETLF